MGLQVVGAVLVGMAVVMVVKARVCVCVGRVWGCGVVVLTVVTVNAGGVGAVFVVVDRVCVVVQLDVDVEAVMLLGALNFVGTVGSSWRLLLDA